MMLALFDEVRDFAHLWPVRSTSEADTLLDTILHYAPSVKSYCRATGWRVLKLLDTHISANGVEVVTAPVNIFDTDAFDSTTDGLRSAQTMSTMREPASEHIRTWFASIAGNDDAPGSVIPSVSAIAVIVDAVPITWHVPGERATFASTSSQSFCVIVPARNSFQYFIVCVPTPSCAPRQLPLIMNPAGT